MSDDGLLADLAAGELANVQSRGCLVCEALEKMSDEAKTAVERALRGTIGQQTLADILERNGYPTGRRAVMNHRREGHTQ